MQTIGDLFKDLIVAGWLFAVATLLIGLYFGLRMGSDLKGPTGSPAGTIPLFVRDDELRTDEGRRWRDRFHLYIGLFFLTVLLDGLAMHIHHKYWP